MKKMFITTIMLLLTLSLTTLANNNSPVEEENVKQVVSDFMSGIDNKNADLLESVLIDGGRFIEINVVDKVNSYSSGELVAEVKSGKVGGWKRNYEISSVELSDNVAIAKVQIQSAKIIQQQFVSLVKVEGAWKVASSCSSMEKK